MIVATNISHDLKKHPGVTIITQKSAHQATLGKTQELALKFSATAKFPISSQIKNNLAKISLTGVVSPEGKWEIPSGMDIVVLLPAGLDFFLTPQNAELFRDPERLLQVQEHFKKDLKRASSMELITSNKLPKTGP